MKFQGCEVVSQYKSFKAIAEHPEVCVHIMKSKLNSSTLGSSKCDIKHNKNCWLSVKVSTSSQWYIYVLIFNWFVKTVENNIVTSGTKAQRLSWPPWTQNGAIQFSPSQFTLCTYTWGWSRDLKNVRQLHCLSRYVTFYF